MQVVDTVAVQRRDHEDFGRETRSLRMARRERQQGVARHKVDLVERDQNLASGLLEPCR